MKKFVFYGELTDTKLMTALSFVEGLGYKMLIGEVNKSPTKDAEPAPQPKTPPLALPAPEVIVSNVPIRRVPDGNAVGANGRKKFGKGGYGAKFRHPSGRTCSDFILEYVRKQGTTTSMDVEDYIEGLGFRRQTASAALSQMWGAGQIERDGNYVGWPKE